MEMCFMIPEDTNAFKRVCLTACKLFRIFVFYFQWSKNIYFWVPIGEKCV